VRSGAMSLHSSARSASALRSSRIERRYRAEMVDPRVVHWADSGAMALTGLPDEPLGPPEPLVEGVERLARRFPGLDALALLGERAAAMALWRRGTTSCGGSCRLFAVRGGWMAVSLPREEDREAVPAWLELDEEPRSVPATWSAVERGLGAGDPDELAQRAALLGLPVARLGEAAPTGVGAEPLGAAPPRAAAGLLVVDLSALWAGPLCGDLLARAGATVVKVESLRRPDGARRGPAAFFDLLNWRKRSVALDLQRSEGTLLLRTLVQRADIVIEASRPRALAQLGISARHVVQVAGPRVWISITGYGRSGDGANRVGFGDDAAVAGGLVAWSGNTPMFCADAVADPLTGLTAANACLEALSRGGRWLLDVSMAGVSAGLSGPTLAVPRGLPVAEARARVPERSAPALGADTALVLAELDLRP
jgi:CoA-transferase family III